MSHIAIVRSSSRAASHQKLESKQDSGRKQSTTSGPNPESFVDRFSELSVISLSSSEGTDIAHEVYIARSEEAKRSASPDGHSSKPMMGKLDRLETLTDLEACFDSESQQSNVIEKLEHTWSNINSNFEKVLQHLQDSSEEVTIASNECLKSLVESIDTCCDSVDEEVKAFYHLMTKCDELTTKLSVAVTFRDEIKTLKKSVETLEQLYKTRPQNTQTNKSSSQ